MALVQDGRELGRGMRSSVRQNAPAYGFSIMITSAFGVTSTLERKPATWVMPLFALGAVAGFVLIDLAATHALRDEAADGERSTVQLLVAALNVLSILAGVGSAALVAWALDGWVAWLVSAACASAAFTTVNGLEYTLAEEEARD
jgi:hypothetical protein